MFDTSAIVNEFLCATPLIVYLLVLGLMVIESSFIPFPSEVIVPPAAYLACTRHDVSIIVILLAATAGALTGALINYGLSYWIGRPIVYKFADSRIGHACLINRAKVDRAERYFDAHGSISTFIGRLIPAVRQLISIPAGLARMNLGKFVIFTSLGAFVWNSVLAALGYWLGTMVKPADLLEYIERYNVYLTYAGLAIALVCVGIIVYNFLKPKGKAI
ncbi:MAG: DedA family protein [Muribaculaceae bacterium]|nr:DedA family protein [Muribaculaceae bacterium]